MNVFVPPKRAGFLWGIVLLVLAAGAVLVPVVLIRTAAGTDSAAGPGTFQTMMIVVAALVIGMFLYFLYSLKTLQYEIAADALIVRWGAARIRVSLGTIKSIEKVPGIIIGARILGVSWPGLYAGVFRLRGIGRVDVFATRLRGEVVLVRAADRCYLLSPGDSERFIGQLRQQVAQVPPVIEDVAEQRPGFWADPLAVILVLGNALFFLGSLLYVFRLVPTLPPRIPAHWDLAGRVNRYTTPEELFMLPVVGAAVAALPVVMGVLQGRRTRNVLYILGVVGLLLQLLFMCILWGWVGMIRG